MLYLEDYMEMIENLPMEMRDRFTEMREMDLQVQNAMDSLDERLKNFFKKCGTTPSLKKEWKDEQFNHIKEDFQKSLEDADENVQLATTIHDLLERYLRKLDQEVSKFKMELEADSAGITEILEKRSLELDRPPPSNNHRAEKRKYSAMLGSSNSVEKRCNNTPTIEHKDHTTSSTSFSMVSNLATREPMASLSRSNSAAPSPGRPMFNSSSQPSIAASTSTAAAASSATPALSYSLGHVGANSNAAIAAAASKAIGATLEMQQGRRTASLKASYEAAQQQQHSFNHQQAAAQQAVQTPSFAATAAEPLPPPPPTTKAARQKKYRAQQQAARQAAAAAAAAQAAAQQQQLSVPAVEQSALSAVLQASGSGSGTTDGLDVGVAGIGGVLAGTGDDASSTSWPYDPNEPRYCICNDVSYGDMVGCDNNDCPIEWFHYGCVALTQAPKGKWYCPQCTAAMKRRGRK